jgi:uncharacterized protein (DUF1330 family)
LTILNISTAVIKDTAKFKDYVQRAAVLLRSHGVEVLCRGHSHDTLRGPAPEPHIVAVFRFSSLDAVQQFYEGEAYQPLIALRDAACEMTIQLYKES